MLIWKNNAYCQLFFVFLHFSVQYFFKEMFIIYFALSFKLVRFLALYLYPFMWIVCSSFFSPSNISNIFKILTLCPKIAFWYSTSLGRVFSSITVIFFFMTNLFKIVMSILCSNSIFRILSSPNLFGVFRIWKKLTWISPYMCILKVFVLLSIFSRTFKFFSVQCFFFVLKF